MNLSFFTGTTAASEAPGAEGGSTDDADITVAVEATAGGRADPVPVRID